MFAYTSCLVGEVTKLRPDLGKDALLIAGFLDLFIDLRRSLNQRPIRY